jgi:hypothetical protein
MTLQTEFDFTLPRGYVDRDGNLHRSGVMRLATARDEIEPMRDPRVMDNEAYLTVILLSRVITQLGDVSQVTPKTVEGLFAADLAYLQDLYEAVNFGGPDLIAEVEAAYRPAGTDDRPVVAMGRSPVASPVASAGAGAANGASTDLPGPGRTRRIS